MLLMFFLMDNMLMRGNRYIGNQDLCAHNVASFVCFVSFVVPSAGAYWAAINGAP